MNKKSSIKIITENLEETGMPLYCQYEGQCNPQPAFITIDPREDEIVVSANYISDIGSGHCSIDEWNNLVKSFSCPPEVLGSALIKYLKSESFQERIQAFCEGFEIIWNGSNHVGVWKNPEDWEIISMVIESDLYGLETGEVYDGRDWIEEDTIYFDEKGDVCNDIYDAVTAKYDNIPITEENLSKLIKAAEDGIFSNQLVNGIDNAFESIIEEINSNSMDIHP